MLLRSDEISIEKVVAFNNLKDDPKLSALLDLFHRAASARQVLMAEAGKDAGLMYRADRQAKETRAALVLEISRTIKEMEDVLKCAKSIAYQTKRLG